MVFLLGTNFPERQLVSKALSSLYGISATTKSSLAISQYRRKKPPPLRPDQQGNNAVSPAQYNLLARLMAQHHIHPTATLGSLDADRLTALTASLSQLTIENDLRRKVRDDIARLKTMNSYRGMRHAMGLPVRGQKTRTQIATARKLNKLDRKG